MKKFIEDIIYNDNKKYVFKEIEQIKDSEKLYVLIFNYNWDDGFEFPKRILENKYCDLSTALTTFYRAGGFAYLSDKNASNTDLEWKEFIEFLYHSIIDKKYKKGKIKFVPPITKIQMFKLKKIISTDENIFLETLEGKNLDIYV